MILPVLVNSFKKVQKKQLIYWLLLFIFSCFTIFSMGRTGADVLSYGLWLYITLCIIRKFSNKGFITYFFLVFFISGLYLPTAVNYGELNLGSIVSLYETDTAESFEFIRFLGIKSYLYLLAYFVLFIIIIKLNKNIITSSKTKTTWSMFLFLVILPIIFNPIKDSVKKKEFSVSILNSFDYYPVRLLSSFLYFSYEYNQGKTLLQESLQRQSTWNIKKVDQSYKNYVVVIGESMRRDYMSAYGYPMNTTPFLAKTNATIFNNFTSASHNTNLSLQRMIFQNITPTDFEYANTLVTLANSANMETHWLSNQGHYGRYDVLASSVAVKADEVFFLEEGESVLQSSSDLSLLQKLKQVLAEPNVSKNRLIVLHLMGSHSGFCSRLDEGYKIERVHNFVNKNMSCYLSTYRQTDKLLAMLYKQLEQQNEPFSMMYFSDHGLGHKKRLSGEIKLIHSSAFKQNYEVPLMIISSDDTKREYIKAPRSGFNLMTGIAEWLGIEESSLQKNGKFFSNQENAENRKVFNGESLVDFSSLENDPAILPN